MTPFDFPQLLTAPPSVLSGVQLSRCSEDPNELLARALYPASDAGPPLPSMRVPPVPGTVLYRALSFLHTVRMRLGQPTQLWLLLDFYGHCWRFYAPITQSTGSAIRAEVNRRELCELDHHLRLAGVIADLSEVRYDQGQTPIPIEQQIPAFDGYFFACHTRSFLHVGGACRIGGAACAAAIDWMTMFNAFGSPSDDFRIVQSDAGLP